MGRRTRYGPGTFCWINLSTTDPDAAKDFYAQLFDWEYDDRARVNGGFSMARRYSAAVAAIYRREEAERAQGLAPHWNNYVSVPDADAAAARASALGGSLLTEPFDVSDAGRTAVLADPAGAMFWVWEPREHIGAGHVNDPGCLTFNELNTDQPGRAIEFYSSLFGWTFERMDSGDGPGYWVIGNETAAMGLNGGMRELPNDDSSDLGPTWVPYFTVDSAVETTETAGDLGGRIEYGPTGSGAGIAALISDPAGAVFGLFEGTVDD